MWCIFLAAGMLGQTPQPGVTLRSTTRLVQVSVIAQDKKGRPVTDLKQDEFEIYDDGKPQRIRVFTMETAQTRAPAVAPATPSEGRVFTNQAKERSGPNAVTAILIDSLNTKWADQAYARKQLIRFLRQIRPEDRIAIYSIGSGGFRVLHDFTQEASDLLARLASWKGEAIAPPAAAERPDPGAQLADWLGGRDRGYVASQATGDSERALPQLTLKMLTAIANQLAGLPGRKNLIWLSDGFPLIEWGGLAERVANSAPLAPPGHAAAEPGDMWDSVSYHEDMVRAMHAVNSADVAIYPVEARGVCAGGFGPCGDLVGRQYVQATQGAMREVASRTGGRAFHDTNDTLGAIRTAINDSLVTYTLGYYPQAARFDGKFHAIKIRLIGRPGVTLRYRKGYLNALEAPADPKRRKFDLEQAAWSPLDANAIALAVDVAKAADQYALTVTVDAATLCLQQDAGRWKGELDVFLVQKDRHGMQLDPVTDTLTLRLKQLNSGVVYRHTIAPNANAATIRVVVRDAGSGNVGSVTIPVAALP